MQDPSLHDWGVQRALGFPNDGLQITDQQQQRLLNA